MPGMDRPEATIPADGAPPEDLLTEDLAVGHGDEAAAGVG